jgi:hypothetical protein
VKADEQLGLGLVVRLEPGAEVLGRGEEGRLHRRGRLAPAMESEQRWIAGAQRGNAVTVNGGVLVAKSGLTTR